MGEEHIEEVYLSLEKDKKADQITTRRSWKESQEVTRKIKKDRHSSEENDRRDRDKNKSSGNKTRDGRRRVPIELKKLSRCANCGKEGHWHKACPEPKKERRQQAQASAVSIVTDESSAANQKGGDNQAMWFFGTWKDDSAVFAQSYWSLEAGCAVGDIAAGEAIIGRPALQRFKQFLRQRGFNVIMQAYERRPPVGVECAAKVHRQALVPLARRASGHRATHSLGRRRPPLLPIGLLKHLEAAIDQQEDSIVWHDGQM